MATSRQRRADQKRNIQEAEVLKAGERDIKFVMRNGSRPAHMLLPTSYIVIDKNKNTQRTMRYVEGQPVWLDEQVKDVNHVRKSIDFIDGEIIAYRDQIALQTYLLNILETEGDNCIFKIDDPEAESRLFNQNERAKAKAISLLYDKMDNDEGVEELRMIARSYGVDADGTDTETMVASLKAMAERDPQGFMDRFNNPRVKMKSLVVQGLNQGLFLTIDADVVKYANGEQVCYTTGRSAEDALTDFALSDKGKGLVEYLENELS